MGLIATLIVGFSAWIVFRISSSVGQSRRDARKKALMIKHNRNFLRVRDRIEQKIANFNETLKHPFPKADQDLIPRYIFIDFETTNLLTDYSEPLQGFLYSYPFVCRASSLIFNGKGELVDEFSSIIKVPEETEFNKALTADGMITPEISKEKGLLISEFFAFFSAYAGQETCIISHDIQFTVYMLELEAKRNNTWLPAYEKYCTMKASKDQLEIVKANSRSKFGYPKLHEMVAYAFFEGIAAPQFNVRNSHINVQLCALIFFKLNFQQEVEQLFTRVKRGSGEIKTEDLSLSLPVD